MPQKISETPARSRTSASWRARPKNRSASTRFSEIARISASGIGGISAERGDSRQLWSRWQKTLGSGATYPTIQEKAMPVTAGNALELAHDPLWRNYDGGQLLDLGLPSNLKPRVSVVSYLNTAPLVWGMLHGPQRGLFDLERALPAECADRLRACRADVRSILLISKVPFPEIRTLATDSSSRTSVELSRIVLARKYGANPTLFAQPPHLGTMLEHSDAALI